MEQFHLEDGRCILVCRVGDTLHAMNGICPHRGAQLAQGTLDGTSLVCPWHDWTFDVESGDGITNPVSCLDKYEVEVIDGKIVVDLDDQ